MYCVDLRKVDFCPTQILKIYGEKIRIANKAVAIDGLSFDIIE